LLIDASRIYEEWLEVLRLKFVTQIDGTSGDHEYSFATVMEGLRILRGHRDVGFHHFPDKETTS
jgi:hypothetical protein